MAKVNFLTNMLLLYRRKSNQLITKKGFTNCLEFLYGLCFFTLEVTNEKAKDKIILDANFIISCSGIYPADKDHIKPSFIIIHH